MIDLRGENDKATLRQDGRKIDEMRQIKVELGQMNNSVNGSATFSIGNTKVAAFIKGPHQVRKILIFLHPLFSSPFFLSFCL